MKWIMRVSTFFTVLNSFLVSMEMTSPGIIVIFIVSIWSMEYVFI